MPTKVLDITLLWPPFLLVLFRVSGLTLAAPVFSSTGIPAKVKVAFSFVLSLMIAPVVFPTIPRKIELAEVISGVFGELMIGLVMGLAVGLVFLAARIAGMIVGQQAGIALGQVVNPMLDGQTTIVGQIYYLAFLMVFLAAGGHRTLVASLLDTFAIIPPGQFRFEASFLTLIEQMLTSAFQLAIRLAGPALIALFMTSLAMGFISRTIPQLNVLTIGFAVRVFVGLIVVALSMPLAFDLLHDATVDTFGLVRQTFGLAP